MLLEKGLAKINKNYYNIYGGSSSNALLVLTGFQEERINLKDFKNFTHKTKNKILEDMLKEIRRNDHLYDVNNKGDVNCLIDIETINANMSNYKVLKIRSPMEILGLDFYEKIKNFWLNLKIEEIILKKN